MTQGTHFPPHFLTIPDTGCGGGRASADRTQRPGARPYPYQQRGVQHASSTWDNRQGAGSPDHLSPTVLGSQIIPESSDSATSPGADSDPYRSYPNTPGYSNGAMSDEFETAQVSRKREFVSGSARVHLCGLDSLSISCRGTYGR